MIELLNSVLKSISTASKTATCSDISEDKEELFDKLQSIASELNNALDCLEDFHELVSNYFE